LCELSIQDTIPIQAQKCLIFVENPKITFLRIANKYFVTTPYKGIHQSAVIHCEAEIATNIYVGPNTYVGKCKIGAGSIIHGNCYFYDNVTVGENVVIHANTVIGADGFGYQRNEDGSFEKFPHIGGVIIEDDVEIGANTCIDRGALGNTIIRNGAKIDNLVHIAHNVVIGRNSAVIANAMIGGSVVVGENTWIAPSASIRDQVTIGNNVTIGMSSLVTKSIPNDEVWIGSPAKKLR
jgi:UDP-3-O-[3-hydroxymyristoyl] glucosamine N-acyltransferase